MIFTYTLYIDKTYILKLDRFSDANRVSDYLNSIFNKQVYLSPKVLIYIGISREMKVEIINMLLNHLIKVNMFKSLYLQHLE